MDCIYCGYKTSVANSRPQKRLQQVWRRRNCAGCGAIFTTIEGVELAGSLVVRGKQRSRTAFSRDTLFMSIVAALGHRMDAISASGALTATIIAQLRKAALETKSAEIARNDIITTTTVVLQRFDSAGSVQYAAYHTLSA